MGYQNGVYSDVSSLFTLSSSTRLAALRHVIVERNNGTPGRQQRRFFAGLLATPTYDVWSSFVATGARWDYTMALVAVAGADRLPRPLARRPYISPTAGKLRYSEVEAPSWVYWMPDIRRSDTDGELCRAVLTVREWSQRSEEQRRANFFHCARYIRRQISRGCRMHNYGDQYCAADRSLIYDRWEKRQTVDKTGNQSVTTDTLSFADFRSTSRLSVQALMQQWQRMRNSASEEKKQSIDVRALYTAVVTAFGLSSVRFSRVNIQCDRHRRRDSDIESTIAATALLIGASMTLVVITCIFNPLMGTEQRTKAIRWLVHRPLMCGFLHLAQWGGAWAGCNFTLFDVAL